MSLGKGTHRLPICLFPFFPLTLHFADILSSLHSTADSAVALNNQSSVEKVEFHLGRLFHFGTT